MQECMRAFTLSHNAASCSRAPPPSFVQLRIALWTGDTRDTRSFTSFGRAFRDVQFSPRICCKTILSVGRKNILSRSLTNAEYRLKNPLLRI